MRTKITAALAISTCVVMPTQAGTMVELCAKLGELMVTIAERRDEGVPLYMVLKSLEEMKDDGSNTKNVVREYATQTYSNRSVPPKVIGAIVETSCLKNNN